MDIVAHIVRRFDGGRPAVRPALQQVVAKARLLEGAERIGNDEFGELEAEPRTPKAKGVRRRPFRQGIGREGQERQRAGAFGCLEHAAGQDDGAQPVLRSDAQHRGKIARVLRQRGGHVEIEAAVILDHGGMVAEHVEAPGAHERLETLGTENAGLDHARHLVQLLHALAPDACSVFGAGTPQRRRHVMARCGKRAREPVAGEGAGAGQQDLHAPPRISSTP